MADKHRAALDAMVRDACEQQAALGRLPAPLASHDELRPIIERLEQKNAEKAGRTQPQARPRQEKPQGRWSGHKPPPGETERQWGDRPPATRQGEATGEEAPQRTDPLDGCSRCAGPAAAARVRPEDQGTVQRIP